MSHKATIPPAELAEVIDVQLSKTQHPIAYQAKRDELVKSGMTVEEAENFIDTTPFQVELIYTQDTGLWAIESEALESIDPFCPYTGEQIQNTQKQSILNPPNLSPQLIEGMDYKTLQNAINKNIPLIWNDPEPIEGNDYTITHIFHMPPTEPQGCDWQDYILLIHYGSGSKAEVTPDEIDFPTVITDPSCNQTCRQIDENVWEYAEDRIINPETGETERVNETIDLSDYTQDEMFESVQPYGYSFNEMCDWIDSGSSNVMLIAECIFEMS